MASPSARVNFEFRDGVYLRYNWLPARLLSDRIALVVRSSPPVMPFHTPQQGLLESRVSRVTRPAGELHDLAEQITPGPV